MKELNLIEGSLAPLWQTDLKFIQDGAIEAVTALLNGLKLGRDNYLVTGCDITVDTRRNRVSMTAGWCFFNGELLPVRELAATSFTAGSNPRIKLTKVTAYDSGGDRSYTAASQTGTVRMWRDSYLAPSVAGSLDVYTLALSEGAWKLAERINRRSRPYDTGLVTATDGQVGMGSVEYRQVGNVVQLYINRRVEITGQGLSGIIASGLPTPAAETYIPVSNGSLTLSVGGILTASTTGGIHNDGIVYLATAATDSNDGHHSTEIGQ